MRRWIVKALKRFKTFKGAPHFFIFPHSRIFSIPKSLKSLISSFLQAPSSRHSEHHKEAATSFAEKVRSSAHAFLKVAVFYGLISLLLKIGFEGVFVFGFKLVKVRILESWYRAALGSVGGVGGGGIFIPILTLIIGFNAKSSTAISKCMIMGAARSPVYYNLRLRHPTLDMPVIDYDLALLFQLMLMLGISIGVAFNVMFADWIVTVLLIILFTGTSTKALFKGIDTFKKETIMKKEATKMLESDSTPGCKSPKGFL